VRAALATIRGGSGSGCGRLRNVRASSATSLKSIEAAAFADDVEQIAMLAGGGVGPFAGRALAGSAPSAARTSSGRACCDIADQPVAALAMAGER
jgi:hypothetical protein